MSLMQDYEEARDLIGHKKYDAISKYLDIVCSQEKCDKYFEALSKNYDLPIDEQVKLKNRMGIIFLNDVLYNQEEWEKFDKWYNEDYLHRKVEILYIWESSHEDMRANAILYQNNKMLSKIVVSVSNDNNIDLNDDYFKKVIYSSFNKYLALPKLSKCSKLLQTIYDNVFESDATMCHIDKDDWNNFYADDYSENDIVVLKEEVKKYGLEDVLTFNEGEYKIVGWET